MSEMLTTGKEVLCSNPGYSCMQEVDGGFQPESFVPIYIGSVPSGVPLKQPQFAALMVS